MDTFKRLLGELLGSKKFWATTASLVVLGASRAGVDIDDDTVTKVMAALGAFVLGTGLADSRKPSPTLTQATKDGPFKTASKVGD